MPKTNRAEERRRARRTMVQESFNLFLVIPDIQGMVRIYMRDISGIGLCFRSEMESDFKPGQSFKARLYMNPGFYLPLDCRVIRVSGGEVAVEFPGSGSGEAISRLQDFFDAAEKHGVLVE
jgi:hypothetical protein